MKELPMVTRWRINHVAAMPPTTVVFVLLCILSINFSLFGLRIACAQGFGKNKVTDQHFDWLIHRTEHFDIYYYPEEAKLVPIMADIAEEAYEKHSEDFEHEIADRTPLILYQSHKDFQETNIILQELHEGIGGFAEIFKRRVVIPFTGSMEAFREVIFHELVHIFQYDIIYQKPAARIYSGEFLYSAPIWFIEGSADYFAEDNDAIGEMVLRDASVHNRIVPLAHLHDFRILGSQVFLGYKMGQLAVKHLVETYGREKVGEIMQELRQSRTKDLNEAFQNVLETSLEEFDEDWRRSVKKKYWPMIEHRDLPDAVSKNLTAKSRYSHNVKPVWSPSGDLIAYVTGNEGFGEIVLMSAKTGEKIDRISKRYFGSRYEEIRSDGRGLTWSPDGDRIAFIGKHRGVDYFLEINILNKKLTHRVRLDFDAASSPSYDGSGERVVFSAIKDAQADLYILECNTGEITRLTHDRFNDTHPAWHPTREEIVFSSEREGKSKLVIIDVSQGTQRQLTHDSYSSISPNWSPCGEDVIFCADMRGVYDIYMIKSDGTELTRLTNIMTGCFNASFSPDRRGIVFGAYQNGKQDICLMETEKAIDEKIDMSPAELRPVALETNEMREHRIARRKYGPKVALDAIFTDFNLGADGLLRNTTELIASDMMGNHRLGLSVANQSGFVAPDFIARYGYLTRRADIGTAIFNYHQYHVLGSPRNRRGLLQRTTGLMGYFSYPFNRYRRVDFQTMFYSTPFTYNFETERTFDSGRGMLMVGGVAFVNDTTRWREFGPHTGARYRFSVEKSFRDLGSDLDLVNVLFDGRRYLKLGRRSTLATRLFLGASFGADRSLFYLGGIDSFRGYRYEELVGTRMGLLNFEVRIPFIDELRFGWPFAWAIGGIRGII
ncbi:MAG: DPP IV N-terminal domain-containing protein, partial [Candidatus Poribacteria bacterium]|nr:DPP IV N-terminal domain-containing protein [Candidatus Poribacteria bacterium]